MTVISLIRENLDNYGNHTLIKLVIEYDQTDTPNAQLYQAKLGPDQTAQPAKSAPDIIPGRTRTRQHSQPKVLLITRPNSDQTAQPAKSTPDYQAKLGRTRQHSQPKVLLITKPNSDQTAQPAKSTPDYQAKLRRTRQHSQPKVLLIYPPKSLLLGALLHSVSVEAEAAEGLSEEDGMGGETLGAGAENSAARSGQCHEGPPSSSQSQRRDRRSGQPTVRCFFVCVLVVLCCSILIFYFFSLYFNGSQRAPDSNGEDEGIDVDRLIEKVREREPLWNMTDRSHADQRVTRQHWEQVCFIVVDNWEDLEPR
ncbi:uncharacterized protein [Ranitomeya imitator]|uniref:uncharacterized protein n=1 Tax=Ranitomeya imitator TaxID=111125 RepID=UPI0037E9BF5A